MKKINQQKTIKSNKMNHFTLCMWQEVVAEVAKQIHLQNQSKTKPLTIISRSLII